MGFGAEFGLLVKRRRAERGLSQDQLATILWPEQSGPKDHPRKPDISRLETGKVANPQERTVLLICEKLGIREDEVNALRLAPPPDPYALAGVLNDLKAASQADLYSLATAFGVEAPEDLSDAKLRAFLTDKAQEYQSYRATIDALDDRVAAIANLKGAAQDAAERLDFDAVEDLLSRVQTVELEIAAATAEARAENALLRGRVKQAHDLLSASADSFAAIDSLEAARRRRVAGIKLYDHGMKFGGAGLEFAKKVLTRLIEDLSCEADPWLWAASLTSLAHCDQEIGKRLPGREGTALLNSAAQRYGQSIEIFDRLRAGEDALGALDSLANTLIAQSDRATGKDRVELRVRAVEFYTRCLEDVETQEKGKHRGVVFQNRAMAYWKIGDELLGARQDEYLKMALADFSTAISILDQIPWPEMREAARQNRAFVYHTMGANRQGKVGRDFLKQAYDDFSEVLTFRSRTNDSFRWAMTLHNRGVTGSELGKRLPGAEGKAFLDGARRDFLDALEVRTVEAFPTYWAMTQVAMGEMERCFADHDRGTHSLPHLRVALDHFDAALTVYDPVNMGGLHSDASKRRHRTLADIARLTPQS